ncbi:MAG: FGGY-family carbohydrate kinase, partial [bacterium]
GLTRGSTRAHVARATLEGVAHEVVDLVEAIRAGGIEVHGLRVDGGAAASDLLMQSCADFAGIPAERPKTLETTALGAARLARIGLESDRRSTTAGQGSQVELFSELLGGLPGGLDRRFEPAMDDASRARIRTRWARAVDTVRFFGSPA